jgi:hypothetical protein
LRESSQLKEEQMLAAHEQQIVNLRGEFIKMEEIYKGK